MNLRLLAVIAGVFATGLAACNPGYMNRSELESKHQGPADCEARCVELGMRMGALVLVSDTLPGCVCQPKAPAVESPKPDQAAPSPSPPLPTPPEASPQGASAAATSYVVAMMAAGASTRTVQAQQKQKAQQSYLPP